MLSRTTTSRIATSVRQRVFHRRPVPSQPAAGSHVREVLENVELKLIEDALLRCDGNKKQAASELGISRSHLYKRLAGR